MTEKAVLAMRREGTVHVVEFNEATVLDAYHVGAVEKELKAMVAAAEPKQFVFDLSTVKMISSQALGVLLNVHKQLEEAGGKMVISGIEPRLYRVFKVTNLHAVFSFYETTEAALAAWEQETG